VEAEAVLEGEVVLTRVAGEAEAEGEPEGVVVAGVAEVAWRVAAMLLLSSTDMREFSLPVARKMLLSPRTLCRESGEQHWRSMRVNNNNNNLQAFQLIVARYLLGVPKP